MNWNGKKWAMKCKYEQIFAIVFSFISIFSPFFYEVPLKGEIKNIIILRKKKIVQQNSSHTTKLGWVSLTTYNGVFIAILFAIRPQIKKT